MAVVTKYVVVRNGVELDEVFAVKKEAEACDNMLDAAENLAKLIRESQILNEEKLIENLAVFLARNAGEVTRILKGIKPISSPAEGSPKDKAAKIIREDSPAEDKAEENNLTSGKKKSPKNRTEKN